MLSPDYEDSDEVSALLHLLHMRPTPPIIEFGKILGSLAKRKRYTIAIDLSQLMEVNGIEPNVVILNILLNCFCRLGQTSSAFSVMGKILKEGYEPTIITLTTLMRGLCLEGEAQKARNFLDDAIAKGFHFNQVSYRILINGLCKIGETRAAMDLLKHLDEQLLVAPNVVMYNIIIYSLCKVKCVTDAFDLYSSMAVKGISPNGIAFNSLIYGFCIVSQFHKVLIRLEKWHCKTSTRIFIPYVAEDIVA